MSPFIICGKTRLLNVPHAAEVIAEIWDEDCYRLNEIPDRSIVIDVGAFYGEFGLICRMNKECGVVAFEPCRANYEMCRLNKELNGAFDRYTLYHCAIAGVESKGPAPVFYKEDHPAGSTLAHYESGIEERAYRKTLGEQIKETKFVLCKDFVTVKLDCEGEEYAIFQDPKWLELVQIVTMEFHNHDGDFYADILEKNGFDVEVTGGGPKPRPKWDKSMGGGLLFAKKRSQ